MSLITGVLLVVIATSGSVVVYEPEIQRFLNSSAYEVSNPDAAPQITMGQAIEAVRAAHPNFPVEGVVKENGIYRVDGEDASYTVDPVTGAVLGQVKEAPFWLGFSDNLHMCLLSCESFPGYVAAMDTTVPGTPALVGDEDGLSVANVTLGVMGLFLVFLALSGLWLWFPRPRRWRSGFTVRMNRGRFARDTDLHKVIGIASLIPLLVWGVTGTDFELQAFSRGWYALVRAEAQPEPELKGTGSGPDIGVDQAAEKARALIPGAEVDNVNLPDKEEPDGPYNVWMHKGLDVFGYSHNPGDIGVYVARSGDEAVIYRNGPDEEPNHRFWDRWTFPSHAGTFVNPWIRAVWFIGGFTPLALMVTGVSTWLYRRNSAKKRAAAKKAAQRGSSAVPVGAGSGRASASV
ncbi:PepSY-associated TM helix domain-containing protein [Gephyromycinifex aptenodytis]|uniref:PepSY-associated TM helix domain-containing protein n=1 Tax=Gephyromycinifex aptenodytis TaxID=2716227 RepID=UPI00144621EB|nr:PepSY-associated TM helix domain-containing protein [Gephyromycinifex aptenodytis]